MGTVEGSGCDVVEAVVVDARQPVGAVWIGPDPALERLLDLVKLLLAASVSTTLSTRRSLSPSLIVSKI